MWLERRIAVVVGSNADNVYYVRQSNLRGHVVRSAA